ncbi:hypothetical protein Tco_0046877 [Tanacetum coccineum]
MLLVMNPAGQGILAVKDQLSFGIFTSSFYDDDFSTTLTNLAPAVEVNPVPTKRVNTIILSHRFCDIVYSQFDKKQSSKNPKFGESAFIGYIYMINKGSIYRLSTEDPDWVAAMQVEIDNSSQPVESMETCPFTIMAKMQWEKWILKNR